ncbi:MAG: hypothetical protein K5770_07780 [Lachnospiraceae bacterium]|nr:hypothetical protein [Lachnospiraceae bacterium]
MARPTLHRLGLAPFGLDSQGTMHYTAMNTGWGMRAKASRIAGLSGMPAGNGLTDHFAEYGLLDTMIC